MERIESSPEQNYAVLQQRLQDAVMGEVSNEVNMQQGVAEFDFWPSKEMKVAEIAPMEMFVRFVEAVARFRGAESRTRKKNTLSYSVSLARKLDDQLPGNDEAVKFFFEGTSYIEAVNLELAEDISTIMRKVIDEKRFSEREEIS